MRSLRIVADVVLTRSGNDGKLALSSLLFMEPTALFTSSPAVADQRGGRLNLGTRSENDKKGGEQQLNSAREQKGG